MPPHGRRPSIALIVAGTLVAALAAVGCGRGSEASREATAEAEQRAQETTITGGAIEVDERVLRERAASLAAFRREQNEYRAKLQAELDALDDVAAAAPGDPAVDARREGLKRHLDALERATEPTWATLRSAIDRDLRGGRP